MGVLDFIRDAFGEELGPEVVQAAFSIDQSRVADIASHLDSVSMQGNVSPKVDGQLRPLVPLPSLTFAPAGWVNPRHVSASSDYEDGATDAALFVDRIRHHLLFCHAVCLEDPWHRIRRLNLGFHQADYDEQTTRQQLQYYLVHLAYAKPLIDSGAVMFIPSTVMMFVRHSSTALDSWMELSKMETAGSVHQELESFWEGWSKEEKARVSVNGPDNFVLMQSAMSLHAALLLLSLLQGAAHLYLEGPWVRPALRQTIQKSGDQLQTRLGSPFNSRHVYELGLLEGLLRLPLPASERLTVEDLVSIRGGGEFESWRSDLKSALAHLDAVDPTGTQWDADSALLEIQDALRGSSLKLRRATRRSASLSSLLPSLLSFCVGGIIGGISGKGPGSIVGSAATTTTGLLAAYALGGRSSLGQRAMLNHYLYFES